MRIFRQMAQRSAVFVAVAALAFSQLPAPSPAQVVTDGTMGPAGALSGPDYAVGADLGTLAGDNLFHSFQSFSLGSGESATFSGPDSVANVISRVTGGQASSIDGTIRSTIPGADLFLINPKGIVFGPDASLDVQGSFAASTADEITFPDGGRFSASDPGASVLSVAPPEAFGFLGPSGTITIDGSRIETSHDLSLIGPEIVIDGTNGVNAPPDPFDPGGRAQIVTNGGDLRLEAPGASGIVHVAPLPAPRPEDTDGSIRIFRTEIDTSGAPSGDIRLVAGEVVVEKFDILAENNSDLPGGGLFVVGNTIAFLEDPLSFPPEDPDDPWSTSSGNAGRCECRRSFIEFTNLGAGAGGGIEMIGEAITLSGGFAIFTDAFGAGSSGGVILDAPTIDMHQGVIGASTQGPGEGGDIIVRADRFTFRGDEDGVRVFSALFTDNRGSADGGDIIVEAREVELTDGGRIGSFVTPNRILDENGETIFLDADGNRLFSRLLAGGSNDGFSIVVDEANNIVFLDAVGDGVVFDGAITVIAPDESTRVLVDSDGTRVRVAGDPVDDEGIVRVYVTPDGELFRPDGSAILASDDGMSFMLADGMAVLLGDDGNPLVVEGREVFVEASGAFFSLDDMDARIDISFSDLFLSRARSADFNRLTDPLLVEGSGTGPGGDVTVSANTIIMRGEDAFRTGIDANTEGDGAAGKLTVNATESIILDGMVGLDILAADPNDFRGQVQLRTASFDDSGKNGPAGDISVTTESLEMFGVAVIDSSTLTEADGGTISIESGFVHLTHGAGFLTRSRGNNGNPGNISLRADTVIFGPTPSDNSFGPTGISTVAFGSADSPTGIAGGVSIEARAIDIQPGTFIDSLTFRPGLAGDISLTASELIYVAGGRQLSSGSLLGRPATDGTRINAGATGGGTGGNILLSAPIIGITRAAVVGAITGGTGGGGTIIISADDLTVSGGARLDAGTLSSGSGGDIFVSALGSVVLRDADSGLFVESSSDAPDAGLAGSIFVTTPDLQILDGAQISTDSAIADGGNITIDSAELVYLSDSAITTSVGEEDGTGSGGNILIAEPVFVVLNDAQILADAHLGPGGNITIVAQNYIRSPDSVLDASSDENIDGTITIDAPEVDLSGAVTELSGELLDAAERLAAQCSARGGRALATFIGRGRSGLPQQPADPVIALYRAPGAATEGAPQLALLPGRLEIACSG